MSETAFDDLAKGGLFCVSRAFCGTTLQKKSILKIAKLWKAGLTKTSGSDFRQSVYPFTLEKPSAPEGNQRLTAFSTARERYPVKNFANNQNTD